LEKFGRILRWLSGFWRGLFGGLFGCLALGGCLRGGDDFVFGGLEFLIGDLSLLMELLEIAEGEACDGGIGIILGPEAFSEPDHGVGGTEHDNEEEDADEDDVARAGFILSKEI
jgi:hypothetical protein